MKPSFARLLLGVVLASAAWPAAAGETLTARFEAESDKSFSRPHDLVLSPDGRLLYVSDVGNDAIKVLDPESLATVAAFGMGELSSPHDVAFDPASGRLLVADTGNDRIAVYRPEKNSGVFLGDLRGGLSAPEGVVADADGRVYVSNARGHDVVILVDGEVVERVGRRGSGPEDFTRPHDIDLGPEGRVFVADPGNDRIRVLSRDLAFLTDIGGPELDFNEPKYFSIDADGRFYVADEYNHRVQILDRDGRRIGLVEGEGRERLSQPEGVTVRGDRMWISDTRNGRIVRYSLQ